jgi:kinetochore protein Mis13/DSN1
LGTVYDNKDGDFEFTKRAKPSKKPASRNSNTEKAPSAPEPAAKSAPQTAKSKAPKPGPAPKEDDAPKTQRKPRAKLPTSPEDNAAPKTGRRSKRAFQEIKSPSPQRASRDQSHANPDRSPSPGFRPVTVKKKRQTQHETPAPAPEEEDKVTKIALPFADTPIIKRNKEMRKASADSNRRSSSGMRGRRASSLIDEGRGNGEFVQIRHCKILDSQCLSKSCQMEHQTNDSSLAALPHPEVPTAEFYKHISAQLTEPTRMRCLLGWCGSRALPPKPDAPKQSSKEANAEFQALQAGMIE